MTTFELIKKLAREQGMTLAQLNEKAGLGKNSIYHWSTKTPSTDSLSKVADVLHVSVDYLLGNTDDPAPASKTGRPNIVDLKEANVFMYEGDRADVDGLDPEDWAIMKAIFAKARKDKKDGK